MPRALPAQLETAMDAGSFSAYFAIGKRTYTYNASTGLPDTFVAFETLITTILYYWYNGLDLTVRYSSANLPADDGLIIGNYYHLERGIKSNGTIYSIKSASLRFESYTINRQIVTAKFALFSENIYSATPLSTDTQTQALTTYNPNADRLSTSTFRATPENADHWDYVQDMSLQFPRQSDILPYIQQRYLIHATDGSDNTTNEGVLYFHLYNPDQDGIWILGDSFTNVAWSDVVWATELSLFVAVRSNKTALNIMTSPDGVTWTDRTGDATQGPTSIAYSPELTLLVAVASGYDTPNNILYSSDGINWTATTSVNGTNWLGVCWSAELTLFVAVAFAGTARVMTSPDGTTWTQRTPSDVLRWQSVCYSPELDLFVAVNDSTGANNRVMYSSDGITWTGTANNNSGQYYDVIWCTELALFVAVGSKIMTSPDGVNWTNRFSFSVSFSKIVYDSGRALLFVTTANTGTYKIASSPDGINWTYNSFPSNSALNSLVYSATLSKLLAFTTGRTVYPLVVSSPDHTITQGDVQIQSNGKNRSYTWLDGVTTRTSGTGAPHNLGILDSTGGDLPPSGYTNTPEVEVEVGIHLKYMTGDLFTLAVNANQSFTYLGEVTEILDPENNIPWRNLIKLIPRFTSMSVNDPPTTTSIYKPDPWTPI
jgi:hypothetical protein